MSFGWDMAKMVSTETIMEDVHPNKLVGCIQDHMDDGWSVVGMVNLCYERHPATLEDYCESYELNTVRVIFRRCAE